MSEAILEIKNLNRDYLRPDGVSKIPVLSNISLTLRQGETLAITGPSGSGKSTLLNIIGTLDRPTSGEVFFKNRQLGEMGDDELSRIRNREIGFVFQEHHLLPQCTALENIMIPTLPWKQENEEIPMERGVELLNFVGLEDRMHHYPSQLSGGEQLRIAVLRSLINDPSLLLADEPTGSLDNVTAREIIKLLLRLNHEKKLTLIVVTHSDELAGMMQRKYVLIEGRLISR